MSAFGDLKYPADFRRFDWVNPDAPKGGSLAMAAIGSFDSLNPYILKGNAAVGVGLVFETPGFNGRVSNMGYALEADRTCSLAVKFAK